MSRGAACALTALVVCQAGLRWYFGFAPQTSLAFWLEYALENNLFAEKAYPQQSEHAFATYQSYVDRGKRIPNLRYVGRHAEFKYWGMPETVNAAYQKALAFEPV